MVFSYEKYSTRDIEKVFIFDLTFSMENNIIKLIDNNITENNYEILDESVQI